MKLYVGNLPHSLTEQDLTDLFSPYGNIKESKLIVDRDTNKSRGFGFVEMESKEEALKAIKELNGKDVEGREIVVNEARPKERRDNNRSSFRRRF
jgi:RNA recognition motif-containing protein